MASCSINDEDALSGQRRSGETLADGVVILLALIVVQRLIGFVRSMLYCRWLTPEQLGQWDVAFGFLMLAAPLSVLAISSAFGRYTEHYRQQGHLRTFIRRTALLVTLLSAVAAAAVYAGRDLLAETLFNDPEQAGLAVPLAFALVTVIVFNYLTDLFTGLRSARMIAVLQLVNSVAFAGLSGLLMCGAGATVANAVRAYALACLVSLLVAMGPLRRCWGESPAGEQPLGVGPFWSKLLSFAAWVWVGSLLSNLFGIADRYLILHCSLFTPEEAAAQVGQYHASRIVPLLLVSVAGLLATIATPHLTQDWEQGRHDRVQQRLNLLLKLVGLGMAAGGLFVLWAAPLLFEVAFRGKFPQGQAILPWTLTYCIWFSMALVAQNYLWCHERARLASLALAAGLVVNVGLNLALMPHLGLFGAVLATTIANLVVLVLICAMNRGLGFHMHRGVWLVLTLPVGYWLGPWPALLSLLVLLLAAVRTDCLFDSEEKQLIQDKIAEYWLRGRELLSWPGIKA